jgi:hypothetical protein
MAKASAISDGNPLQQQGITIRMQRERTPTLIGWMMTCQVYWLEPDLHIRAVSVLCSNVA